MLKDDQELKKFCGLRLVYLMVHNYIASYMCSFLGCGLEFSLSLLSAMITLLEPEIALLLSGVTLLHGLGERLEDGGFGSGGGELIEGGGDLLLDLTQIGGGLSGVINLTLLRLILFSGEEDELLLVLGESGNVKGLSFSRLVVSSVINSDTNSSGKSGRKSGFLELSERETSTNLGLTRVLLSASVNNRSQQTKRSRRNGGSLSSSLLSSDLLMSGLVEEAFDTPHPVLSEMRAL